jgi:hypothetical protein
MKIYAINFIKPSGEGFLRDTFMKKADPLRVSASAR